jgi:DMSO/TMAO reductase YedYZ molybdopterin-dependent catalytic subunit
MNRRRVVLCGMPLILMPCFGGAAAQEAAVAPKAPAATLRVDGLVDRPHTFTAADLARLPRHTVQTRDPAGQVVRFEGVALGEVLKAAGAPVGDTLRGPELTKFLLVRGADDYRAVFALPELAPAFTEAVVLVADRRDGQPLDAKEGPLRLVVPHERRPARWVRQVVSLTVMDARAAR